MGTCDLIHGQPEEYEQLRERLLARIALKTRMIRDVVQEGEWDVVAACFADTHCAGHQLWNLHAGANGRTPEAGGAAPRDAMRDVRGLARMLQLAPSSLIYGRQASEPATPAGGGK